MGPTHLAQHSGQRLDALPWGSVAAHLFVARAADAAGTTFFCVARASFAVVLGR